LQVDENAKMNERRVNYFASVSNRSVLCRVKRHLNPVMDAELLVQRIANKISLGPTRQIFEKQVLAKVLTPGEFEVGLRSHSLSRYSYAPGEMILCRRNTEEWVCWHSPIQMLLITVPDRTFHSVAEEMGGRAPELNGTPLLEDERIRALVAAAEADHAGGSPAGRIYLDSIGRALAAALLHSQGVLRSPMRHYVGGLSPVQLRRVASFVHEHLHEDVSLMQMAEEAKLSRAYFSQMFRQSTGVAPHQFVLRARVERAKELLVKEDARILDVAIACGFQTQQHFARAFRALCKVSPTQFRRARLA
jgi:AraC family transcriptional regulator